MTVVGRKGHAHNIMSVIFESASCFTGRQIPQTEIFVPRAGQSKVAVRGKDDVRDEVAMTMKTLLWDTIVLFIAGQLPNDEGLVTRRTEDDVGILGVCCDLGNPSAVAREGTTEL